MNQQTIANPELFDLLARNWQRPSAIIGVHFNADASVLVIACQDGTIALARVADSEPPESRIRVSVDLGQTRIRPRSNAPAPLIEIATTAATTSVATYLDFDFVLGLANEDVIRLGHDGAAEEILFKTAAPVVAVDHCRATGATIAIDGHHLYLKRKGEDAKRFSDIASSALETVSISNGGKLIAVGARDRLSIRPMDDPAAAAHEIALPSFPLTLQWRKDDRFIACGLVSGGFCLLDVAGNRSGIVPGFAGPVRAICWSTAADALITSGAFRIAGWSMASPPLDRDMAGALLTGRSGFVTVDAVAAHPKKNLVAAGYASGRITVSPIGSPAELLVRPSGGSVTVLAWSAGGQHLAVGDAEGNAAIVTFPPQIFK